MGTIRILDKTFSLFISYERIQEAIMEIALQLEEDFKQVAPLFLCVLNGSFIFAADLFKVYQNPAQITFIRLSSYKGTATSEEVKTVIGLTEDIEDRDLVILEDIIDSGLTITHLMQDLKQYRPRSIKVATLLLKPEALKMDVRPEYVGMEIPNDFIVGYGLDYNGYGRNLKDIYKIVE